MARTFDKHSISADLGRKMIDAAIAKAEELKIAVVVAVIDEAGHLKAFCRMDGAALISVDVAQAKAYTSLFGLPSGDLFNVLKGNPGVLAALPNMGPILPVGGGLPVRVDGALVGAIGVSGGSVEQDIACAQAGLDLAA
jgi:uncharacterized protein GlcG (DUF336 family)